MTYTKAGVFVDIVLLVIGAVIIAAVANLLFTNEDVILLFSILIGGLWGFNVSAIRYVIWPNL